MNLSDIETWYLNLQMQIHLYEALKEYKILKDSWSGSKITEDQSKILMINNDLLKAMKDMIPLNGKRISNYTEDFKSFITIHKKSTELLDLI